MVSCIPTSPSSASRFTGRRSGRIFSNIDKECSYASEASERPARLIQQAAHGVDTRWPGGLGPVSGEAAAIAARYVAIASSA